MLFIIFDHSLHQRSYEYSFAKTSAELHASSYVDISSKMDKMLNLKSVTLFAYFMFFPKIWDSAKRSLMIIGIPNEAASRTERGNPSEFEHKMNKLLSKYISSIFVA